MKKGSILLIILMVIFSFIHLANGGEKEEEKKIQWKFLNAIPFAEDWYRQVLDPYMAEHPEQSYEITSIIWSDFYEKFTTAAATGTEMDVIFLDISLVPDMSKPDVLLDITDMLGDIPNIIKFDHPAGRIYVNDGRIYAIPILGIDTMGVFYNKKIFQKYGLEIPETYEDLVAVSKELRRNGIGPFLTNGEPWQWSNLVGAINTQVIDNYDQYMIELANGKHKFTDPELVEGLRWLKRFRDDGVFVDDIIGIDENTSYSMFLTGQAAMFFQGSWIVPILSDMIESEEELEQFGVMPLPYLTPERRIGAHGCFCYSIGLYKDIPEEKKQPALDLISYMTSAEVNKILSELSGAVSSTRKDVLIEMTPLTAEFGPIAPYTYAPWGIGVGPAELLEIHRQSSQAVAGGIISPEEAAQNVQVVFDKIMGK